MEILETDIDIDAPADVVWWVLTDFDAMAAWNPFIRSISGMLAEGERLAIEIVPPGRPAMRFKPILVTVEPRRELRWRGVVVSDLLFAGEHAFHLDTLSDGRTHLTQREVFSGLLVPIAMTDAMLAATRQGFIAMNEALAARAESASSRRRRGMFPYRR